MLEPCDTVGTAIDQVHHEGAIADVLVGGHTRSRALISRDAVRGCTNKPVAFYHLYSKPTFLSPATLTTQNYFFETIFDHSELLYFGDIMVLKFRDQATTSFGLSYDRYQVGVEVKKRTDDSYFGVYLIEYDRVSHQIQKSGFLPSSQYEKPFNDNLLFFYDGEWKLEVQIGHN